MLRQYTSSSCLAQVCRARDKVTPGHQHDVLNHFVTFYEGDMLPFLLGSIDILVYSVYMYVLYVQGTVCHIKDVHKLNLVSAFLFCTKDT